MAIAIQVIDQNSPSYPILLLECLGKDAPARLWAIGRIDLIHIPKTALFCSRRCTGDAILTTMDQARKWRYQGRCIISGFHSPMEKECLQILLRGTQPVIICPARSLETMRIPKVWRPAIKEGRFLMLSMFPAAERRMTAALGEQRNQLVAAMADDVFFAQIAPKGQTSRLSKQIEKWNVPKAENS